MFKKLIAATAIATVTLFTAAPAVFAHDGNAPRWGAPGYENDHRRTDRRESRGRNRRTGDVRYVRLNRWIENEALPLRRLLGLGRDSRGYRIDEIIVRTKPGKSRGSVRLLVNGRKASRGHRLNRRIIALHPGYGAGRIKRARSLRLDVRGYAFIRDIKVKLTRNHTHRKPSHFRPNRRTNAGIGFDGPNPWVLHAIRDALRP